MVMTDKEKLVLTPTYHVFRMYVPFQNATFVPLTLNAGTYTHGDIVLPRVDADRGKGRRGTLWLAATNLHPTRSVEIAARLAASAPRPRPGKC
jgi:alpha-N-arabinofuranosidase